MILKNYYWYFKKAIPKKICEEIIKLGLLKNNNLGVVSEFEKTKNLKKLIKIRNSNVAWLNEKWIYNYLHPYIATANKNAGWNFQWDYSESCQFTIYGKNQHYDWHVDTKNDVYTKEEKDDVNFIGKIRKLSMTLSLTDEKKYEGGKLQFDFRNNKNGKPAILDCNEIKSQGSIVVFPSFIWHRVTPVTKGTRHSLVMWNLGYPFK